MDILKIRELEKSFLVKHGFFGQRSLKVLQKISLSLEEGKVLGLVGESGSGKTTLARAMMRLIEPDAGDVVIKGKNISILSATELRRSRKNFQMIFQDPYSSLNPRMRVFDLIQEPLKIHHIVRPPEVREHVAGLLTSVGLRPEMMDRFPHEFSGGQRQRIGIARALAVEPSLIVGDEPVSALDVSVQAQIINLLMCLKREKGLSMVIISHDLKVVERMSDEIAVMYFGRVVESGHSREIINRPLHPYTEALISAVPRAFSHAQMREKRVVRGDIPSFHNPPGGCAFHPRCPLAKDHCKTQNPIFEEKQPGHWVACHEVKQATHG